MFRFLLVVTMVLAGGAVRAADVLPETTYGKYSFRGELENKRGDHLGGFRDELTKRRFRRAGVEIDLPYRETRIRLRFTPGGRYEFLQTRGQSVLLRRVGRWFQKGNSVVLTRSRENGGASVSESFGWNPKKTLFFLRPDSNRVLSVLGRPLG